MSIPAADHATFLFTDIEGSTRLWEKSQDVMRRVLARHDALAHEEIEKHGGRLVKSRGEGDSLFAVFESAPEAAAAACALETAFCAEAWPGGWTVRVRMALHSGGAELRDQDYYGPTINRCARLRAIGHGGQVLASEAVSEALGGALPVGVTLRDLGRHRLKDLQQPEQVYQLCYPGGPQEFPRLLSLNYVQHNLPIQTTSFVGQESEVAEIRRLLDGAPCLTLVGPGGTGKTRLALQAAAERIDQAPDGVWLVDLAPVADATLVPAVVASVLGVGEEPGQTISQTVRAFLKPRTLLLVLDNCEHLIEACAPFVDDVLRACPAVKVLATSRERIGVPGERVYHVPPLALPPARSGAGGSASSPEPSALMQFASVRLFCERATMQQPDFTLSPSNAEDVAQICRKLDGIPLAIELAAARVRALSPSQIVARLDDRFRILRGGSRTALPRQQTLEALIDWSYDLLTAPEKAVLHSLTVFSGGWTLEAAEAVCGGTEVEEWEVLDLLTSLVDKSLVAFGDEEGGRYRLLETIRHYAALKREQLGDGGGAEARRSTYFIRYAREAEPHLQGADQAEWLRALEREHDNMRAVLARCLPESPTEAADGRAGIGLELCCALRWFWHVRGHLREGRTWLSRAVAANTEPTEARAEALTGLGTLALKSGDAAEAETANREALAIRRERQDSRGVATSLTNLGHAAFGAGRLDEARELFAESVAIWDRLCDDSALARALNNLGAVAHTAGAVTEARDLYLRGLERLRAAGDSRSIAVSLYNLAELAMSDGDFRSTEGYLRESLTYLEKIEDGYVHATVVHMLGMLAHRTGRGEAAVQLWSAAQAALDQIGAALSAADGAARVAGQRDERARLGDARYRELSQAGQNLPLDRAAAVLEEITIGDRTLTSW